jgi:hypothetical protein
VPVGAFIDESGNDGHSPVMVLSALVANIERWKLFSDEWQDELSASPKIKCFKSYDAATLENYFKGFTHEEAEHKTDRLASVILKHIEYGIVELVYNDEFDEIIKGQLYWPKGKLPRKMNDPYFLLFYGLVKNIIREQFSRKDKVDFTFDNYNKVGRECLRHINDGEFTQLLPDGYKDIIGRAIPGNDEEFLPLQAADLVAGQYRRFIGARYFRDSAQSASIMKLRGSRKILSGLIEKLELKKIVADINVTWSVMVLSKIKEEREKESK